MSRTNRNAIRVAMEGIGSQWASATLIAGGKIGSGYEYRTALLHNGHFIRVRRRFNRCVGNWQFVRLLGDNE